MDGLQYRCKKKKKGKSGDPADLDPVMSDEGKSDDKEEEVPITGELWESLKFVAEARAKRK